MFKKTFIVFVATYTFIYILAAATIAGTGYNICFSVSPPATWSGDPAPYGGNGTLRTLSGVLPGDWKENEEVSNPSGSYSNRLFCRGMNSRKYRVSIWLSSPLISTTGKTLPTSSLKYIFTYTNGVGTTYNLGHYVVFSASPADIYYSTTLEGYPDDNGNYGVDIEFQFKYAIQTPDNQSPGIYSGVISYKMEEEGTGAFIETRTCPINVVVGDFFRLSIDRGTIDFEKMNPGDSKDNVPVEGIIITSKTNTGNPWFLKISNDSPLSTGPYLIPNSNFIWYGWSNGAGRWYGNGTNTMTLVPELMYSSGATEGNNMPNGTNNHLKFKLTVPKGQAGGKYISRVKITQTE